MTSIESYLCCFLIQSVINLNTRPPEGFVQSNTKGVFHSQTFLFLHSYFKIIYSYGKQHGTYVTKNGKFVHSSATSLEKAKVLQQLGEEYNRDFNFLTSLDHHGVEFLLSGLIKWLVLDYQNSW